MRECETLTNYKRPPYSLTSVCRLGQMWSVGVAQRYTCCTDERIFDLTHVVFVINDMFSHWCAPPASSSPTPRTAGEQGSHLQRFLAK